MSLTWKPILKRAAEIAGEYPFPITLRQLFYRLVAEALLPNASMRYRQLSERTAKLRRQGAFPNLVDHTRRIERPQTWTSPQDALDWLADQYREDRTIGQPYRIYIGAEKETLADQLWQWYNHLGVGIVCLKGYSSQSLDAAIADELDDRPAVLIYAGDLDPSGEDIQRNLSKQIPGLTVHRIALTDDQVDIYHLEKMPGKKTDPRAGAFIAEHGSLYQVEVEALPPDVLKDLYDQAVDVYMDRDMYDQAVKDEAEHREELET